MKDIIRQIISFLNINIIINRVVYDINIMVLVLTVIIYIYLMG